MKKEIDETREMVVMYEGLVNKLTEQNGKLKALNKTRKARKRSLRDTKSMMKKFSSGIGNDQSMFDVQLSIDKRSEKDS